jgi:hypothetical protein
MSISATAYSDRDKTMRSSSVTYKRLGVQRIGRDNSKESFIVQTFSSSQLAVSSNIYGLHIACICFPFNY